MMPNPTGQPMAIGASGTRPPFARPDLSIGRERAKGRAMDRKEEYLAKLRDPRWQKKRLKILERDDWTCRLCGSKEHTLHVHHARYIRDAEPWDCPDALLVTACEVCHEIEPEWHEKILTNSARASRTYRHPDVGGHHVVLGSEAARRERGPAARGRQTIGPAPRIPEDARRSHRVRRFLRSRSSRLTGHFSILGRFTK